MLCVHCDQPIRPCTEEEYEEYYLTNSPSEEWYKHLTGPDGTACWCCNKVNFNIATVPFGTPFPGFYDTGKQPGNNVEIIEKPKQPKDPKQPRVKKLVLPPVNGRKFR